MLRSIFTKTLYEKRVMTLLWVLAVAAMALLMMTFYDSFSQGQFDEALQNLPDAFRGIVGDLASLKTVPGYVSQQVFAVRIPLLAIIMAVMLFTGLLAGDESDGTLQSLLTQPVSRTQVFLEKYLAGLIISFVISLGAVVGVLAGLTIINETMSLLRLIQAATGVWLLAVVFGSFAYALGAITGQKGLAGSLAGLFAFGSYLITSFAPNVSTLSAVGYLSPFYFYNNPSIAEFGLDISSVLVLVSVNLALITVSWLVFNKRDIQQK